MKNQPLDQPTLYRVKHRFKTIVSSELLIDRVQMVA
jgi:hypothetical protein